MGKADLHIHTTASDGRSEPVEIVKLAAKHKLETIAITDHDTIAAYKEAHDAAKSFGIRLLTGVEFTSDFHGRECHLLAYCFEPDDTALQQLLQKHRGARADRGKWILGQLAQEGLSLDMDEVKAIARGSNIGRPHIAQLLIDKGYVASIQEAFIRYLSDTALGTIKNNYSTFSEVIEIVKGAGGATVVAHPGKMYRLDELEEMVENGIDGIEVLHPSHDYKTQKKMDAFAGRHQLLKTGGSDFHGAHSGYHKYFGVITVSSATVQRLITMTDQRKKIFV